jgi:hypothetical protein
LQYFIAAACWASAPGAADIRAASEKAETIAKLRMRMFPSLAARSGKFKAGT